MSASLNEIMGAIAAQIETELGSALEGVQVDPKLVYNPTPPCIDVYPADPFLTANSFGENYEALFVVRARVATADQQGGQELLLDLLDPRGPTSLAAALAADRTFAGTVDDSCPADGSPSGFVPYQDQNGAGYLLGAEWRLRVVLPSPAPAPPLPDPPILITAPTMTSRAVVGQTLTWDPGAWDVPVVFAFEVQVDRPGYGTWDYWTFETDEPECVLPPDPASVGFSVRVAVNAKNADFPASQTVTYTDEAPIEAS